MSLDRRHLVLYIKVMRANDWVIMATPITMTSASNFKITSQGLRCANKLSFTITAAGCGAGATTW